MGGGFGSWVSGSVAVLCDVVQFGVDLERSLFLGGYNGGVWGLGVKEFFAGRPVRFIVADSREWYSEVQ